ncbi:MAG: response regulator [Anaerolineales bacterium]|nr:response regulator [Anaerolineales bacterium]
MPNNLTTPTKQDDDREPYLSALVVDDEPTFCDVVCEILESYGFECFRAYSATDALTFLESNTPDVILTDIMMPDIDGLTLIYKIRSVDRSAGVPIIVFSAKATMMDRNTCIEAGASEFLAKPFSTNHLMEAIQSLLPSSKSLSL